MSSFLDNFDKNNSAESIALAINSFDKEMLVDTLSYLIKLYVIDKGVGYKGGVTEPGFNSASSNVGAPAISQQSSSFAELIRLAKSGNNMRELDLFEVEGERVYIRLNDRRHLINSSGRGMINEGAVNTFADKINTPPKIEPNNNDSSGSSESPERFRNLELDG